MYFVEARNRVTHQRFFCTTNANPHNYCSIVDENRTAVLVLSPREDAQAQPPPINNTIPVRLLLLVAQFETMKKNHPVPERLTPLDSTVFIIHGL